MTIFDNYLEDDYFCTVSLFFNSDLYCLICRPPFYKKWEKVILHYSSLRDAVSFCNGEKLCTLYKNGKLGIIQIIPEISTCLSPITPPTDPTAMYRKRLLVSWQNHLFLVQHKLGSVLEIWKADFKTQQFKRIFNLDKFIIFISQGFSVAVSSSALEEKNCVYFTQGNDNHILFALHIGDQSLSTTERFRIHTSHNSIPLLERLGTTKNQGSRKGDDKVKKRSSSEHSNTSEPVVVDSNICDHLTLDLQREISRHLLSQDAYLYMNFRLVCKLWRSVAPPLRWKVVDQPTRSSDQDSMWLLTLNQKDGLCTFYNPFRNLTCYMSNNDLVGFEIRYSKDGWLLVSRGPRSLFLLEPSSKQIIHLPERTDDYFCDAMSFSASPSNSSAWVIFGIACLDSHRVRISYLRAGDDNWTSMRMDNEVPFIVFSSPVYFGEKFCVVGRHGDVGAFGFLEDGNPYWVIHQISLLYSPRISSPLSQYLVQRDQDVLYSVIMTRDHNVGVYELDFRDNRVKLVKEVKNWLLFISEASSIAVCGMNVNLDDALLFPSFSTSNDYVYYSLEAAAFKVLKDNSIDIRQQKELLNRVWIRCELRN
ncbi:hypothetical protein A4A49_37833 [Nicotiana attenuata]|uniref:KIB1-4 beta-propeller domain-containing protein n=2 Tax=Nicotiana attenuata TaxID=49451 RepID=A0A1J6KE09_NICAT|nr:hypothetical protein A4A49_37833 [Nicotiana attenuata]